METAGQTDGPERQPSFVVDLGTFEGPLELLLYLVEKNRFTLHDIEVRPVIDQYLAYIERARRLDISLAGEFLDMASYLIWLKSRLLLPHADQADTLEGANPVQELKEMLIEYHAIRAAARNLGSLPMLHWDRFPRGAPVDEREIGRTSLGPLLEAVAAIRSRTRKIVMDVSYKRFGTQEIISRIQSLFSGSERLSLREAAPGPLREDLIATLMAALEMARLRLVCIVQRRLFSAIFLVRRPESATGQGGGTGERP